MIAMFSFCSVFRFKYGDGIYGMDKFYELPKNTVDILILGSSHAFEDINPAVLFSEYGITAFVLAGSIQPMWNTYFYLCEALRTQKPKVVILEAYCCVHYEEYIDESRIVKNTYGIKPSIRYVNALKVSAPNGEFWDYFLRFTRYHSRYTTLSKEDFLPNMGNNIYIDWKGFGNNTDHTPFEQPRVNDISNRFPMLPKTESYYRAVIELCIKENIPLEIVIVPFVISPIYQAIFNNANDIATEYNTPFTNLNNNYDKIGFDFLLDMADWGHANYRGNIKISRYIGTKLKEKYIISDNRENPLYASWQRNADYFWRVIDNQNLKECIGINEYLEQIINSQYLICSYINPEMQKELDIDNNSTDLSIRILNRTIQCLNIGSIDRFKQFGSIMISLDKMNNTLINGIGIELDENNINLIIYDPVTDTIVDNVSFDFYNSIVIHQQFSLQ
jgi:hypothetical protein